MPSVLNYALIGAIKSDEEVSIRKLLSVLNHGWVADFLIERLNELNNIDVTKLASILVCSTEITTETRLRLLCIFLGKISENSVCSGARLSGPYHHINSVNDHKGDVWLSAWQAALGEEIESDKKFMSFLFFVRGMKSDRETSAILLSCSLDSVINEASSRFLDYDLSNMFHSVVDYPSFFSLFNQRDMIVRAVSEKARQVRYTGEEFLSLSENMGTLRDLVKYTIEHSQGKKYLLKAMSSLPTSDELVDKLNYTISTLNENKRKW